MNDLAEVLGRTKNGDGWDVSGSSRRYFPVILDVVLESWYMENIGGALRPSVVLREHASGALLMMPLSQLRVVKDAGGKER